jgi:hypothetical protein
VRFNLRTASIKSVKDAKKPAEAPEASASEIYTPVTMSEFQEEDGSSWDSATEPDANSASGAAKKEKFPAEGLFTLAELEEIFGAENVRAEYKTVNALPALTRSDYSGDLLTRVTLTVAEDGKETVKMLTDRYCDCEGSPKLRESAGGVPSYVLLIMGSSNAGKTMFLLSLFHTLRRDGGYPLPPGGTTLSLEALSDRNAQFPISAMEKELFSKGTLPTSTNRDNNEPLVMDVVIKFKTGARNNALIYFRDMPGEHFTDTNSSSIKNISDQFPLFDGFLLALDPLTFEESVFQTTGQSGNEEQREYINRLREVIVDKVIPNMPGSVISQPTAIIVTKGDMFFDKANIPLWKSRGIPPSNPVIASGLNSALANKQESFDKAYFEEVNAGVLQIIKKLSNNIPNFIETRFDNVFYTMISAMGTRPIQIEDRTVLTPTALSPWRVSDPMLRLFMLLNIIPRYDGTLVRASATETPEERKARKFRNNKLLNDWGEKYCGGWIQIPPDN